MTCDNAISKIRHVTLCKIDFTDMRHYHFLKLTCNIRVGLYKGPQYLGVAQQMGLRVLWTGGSWSGWDPGWERCGRLGIDAA